MGRAWKTAAALLAAAALVAGCNGDDDGDGGFQPDPNPGVQVKAGLWNVTGMVGPFTLNQSQCLSTGEFDPDGIAKTLGITCSVRQSGNNFEVSPCIGETEISGCTYTVTGGLTANLAPTRDSFFMAGSFTFTPKSGDCDEGRNWSVSLNGNWVSESCTTSE